MNVTARLSPRTSEPGCTRPPSRNRLPGAICFSATIAGVEKNTIESRIAFSTSAAATASTASEPPIIVKRRCLRVMPDLRSCAWCYPKTASYCSACLSIEPEILEALVQLSQPLGIVGDGLLGVRQRALRLVAVADYHIGTYQPQPSLDVVAILLQSRGETLDHATDHRAAVGLGHVLGCGHRVVRQRRSGGTAGAHQRSLNHRAPRRIGWRSCQHRAPDRGGLRAAAVLLCGQPKKIAGLEFVRVQRGGAFEF